jgi:hypothetical protein
MQQLVHNKRGDCMRCVHPIYSLCATMLTATKTLVLVLIVLLIDPCVLC